MPATVTIRGLPRVISSLKTLERDLGHVSQRIVKDGGEKVAQTAKGLAPRRSGRLAGSIHVTTHGDTATVGTGNLIYAGPIIGGWRRHNISPHPFLTAALAQNEAAIARIAEQRVAELVRKVHGL